MIHESKQCATVCRSLPTARARRSDGRGTRTYRITALDQFRVRVSDIRVARDGFDLVAQVIRYKHGLITVLARHTHHRRRQRSGHGQGANSNPSDQHNTNMRALATTTTAVSSPQRATRARRVAAVAGTLYTKRCQARCDECNRSTLRPAGGHDKRRRS